MGIGAIVVGAGPVGLMLAGELRLGGVEAVVCEQRPTPSGESRGVGFTRRAAEVFDQRGLLSRFGEIEVGNEGHFGGVRFDWSALPDNHFGFRGVPQHQIEAVLAVWLAELGVPVLRDHTLADLRVTADGVVGVFDRPEGRFELEADYLVGCDGGHSTVRRLSDIGFPGRTATRGMYVADVAGRAIRPRVVGERVPGGMVMAVRLEEGIDRIIIHPDVLSPREASTVTFAEIADSWQSLTGESLHDADVRWVSAFTDATRQAERYRRGRVLLAGDACHVHIPAGAQGLSLGVQDAVNLGWKLAATIRGQAPDDLLDTYHTERHPVGARVLRNTLAQSSLYLTGSEVEPLRIVLRELVTHPEAAWHLAGMVSGLDVRYEMGGPDHPLVGFRLRPDRELDLGDDTRVRVADLLHRARGVLIVTGYPEHQAPAVAGWSDRVDVVAGAWATDPPVAPGAGRSRPQPVDAVLLRPDGYVAWAAPGEGDIAQSLQRWFGSPQVV